jgi:hypothetical protein
MNYYLVFFQSAFKANGQSMAKNRDEAGDCPDFSGVTFAEYVRQSGG